MSIVYKEKYYYWGFVDMVQNVIVAFLINVYYEQVIFKVQSIVIVLLVSNFLSISYKPFVYQSVNRLQIKARYVQIISIIFGSFMYANGHGINEEVNYEWIDWACVIGLVLANIWILI